MLSLLNLFIAEASDADVEDDLSGSSSRSSLVDVVSTQDSGIQEETAVAIKEEPAVEVKDSSSELAMDLTFHDEQHNEHQNEEHVFKRYEMHDLFSICRGTVTAVN